jgi:hypothetical protein
MSKAEKRVSIAEMLRTGPIAWPRPDPDFDIMKHIAVAKAHVVFEDEHVVAFERDNDDDRERGTADTERRITIAPKKRIESFLDIGIAEGELSAHLLFALQQVAYKLDLHKSGFEVRFNVLPPYQRRPHFSLQLRCGDPKNSASVS